MFHPEQRNAMSLLNRCERSRKGGWSLLDPTGILSECIQPVNNAVYLLRVEFVYINNIMLGVVRYGRF